MYNNICGVYAISTFTKWTCVFTIINYDNQCYMPPFVKIKLG